jgi:thymidylate synthase ThyX
MITAEIVADSLNPQGVRLTTFVLEYPRFVHAEFMTHRMFSKNAASSRAIPIEKMIEQIKKNPAMPVWWGKNQSGMQAKEELSNDEIYQFSPYLDGGVDKWSGMGKKDAVKAMWLDARDDAIGWVKKLNELGLHKQIANRILEPWFNIRLICSATDYENFFALRVHEDAQPEIRELASKMLELYNNSIPKKLNEGEWHIPFGDNIDETRLLQDLAASQNGWAASPKQLDESKRKIAIARCARISYFNYEGKDDYMADIKLCDRLFGSIPRHLSPTEHVAQALNDSNYYGNFKGFKQYRKTFEDENLSDPRVRKHT